MEEKDLFYTQIKDLIIDTETTIKVKDYSKNKVVLENYYEIGRMLVEAQGGESRAKYGDGLIKEYSKKLSLEIGKKYSYRLLFRIRQFYQLFKNENMSTLSTLSWSHYTELLSLGNTNEINYYIDISNKYNLTVRDLREKIKSKEYDKLSDSTKKKLMENEKPELTELIKNPIVISNASNIEIVKEKTLQKLILDNIPSFLKQLGNKYYFVDNEYSIKIGNTYHKIDILLFNKEYKSYVVIELKIGELKKDHLGQIMVYMNYVDKNIKDLDDNKTIGIILCHKNNELIMEYCSDSRIITREYIVD